MGTLRNGELYKVSFLSCGTGTIKERRIRWYGHVTHMEGRSNLYQNSIGKPEWKRQLEKPRC
jgi:hypothetical protein